jgi:hypothetical protein
MERTKQLGLALMMVMLPAAKGLFAQAAPGEIRGRIFEKKDVAYPGNALVWVDVNGGTVKTQTDDEGRYILKPLDAGTYIVHVVVEADTFKLQSVVNPNEITKMKDMDLSSNEYKSKEIDGVDIVVYTDPLIRVEGASMEIVRAKELVHSPAKHDIKQIVASMTSGVKVTDNGDAYVRGSRADAINYYLDGMRLRDGFVSPPASALSSVSVYTGGVPAKYGDCTGGVVVMETKNYLSLYQEWLATQGQ